MENTTFSEAKLSKGLKLSENGQLVLEVLRLGSEVDQLLVTSRQFEAARLPETETDISTFKVAKLMMASKLLENLQPLQDGLRVKILPAEAPRVETPRVEAPRVGAPQAEALQIAEVRHLERVRRREIVQHPDTGFHR